MLKIVYRTARDRVAALLPPGIEAAASGHVNLTIYNLPVNNEPEYGILMTVDADYKGTAGEWAIGYGISQESAIFISYATNGQPKFPCETDYFRLGDTVSARCSHQRYTFVEFEGRMGQEDPLPAEGVQRHEWWVKVSRQVGGGKGYDFPPHVVQVKGKYGPGYRVALDGQLTLTDSPWDPIASCLPLQEQVSAHLWWPEYLSREITLADPLDPEAFWPHIDNISGSRWPGHNGGPLKASVRGA
jgi:acetoacetate decarboxylase